MVLRWLIQGQQFKDVRTRLFVQYFLMGAYLCPEPTPDRIRPWVSDKTSQSETNSRRTNQNLTNSRVQSYSLDGEEKKCSIEDFVIKGELGEGGFASVYIVELKRNIKRGLKKEFAMKKIGKKKLKDRKVIENLKVQRMVYTSIKNNFIISLNYAFQDKAFCYFVMEYAEGGDVYSLINNSKQPMKSRMYKLLGEEGAKFIFACVVLGMESAHGHNIIYRDLKPQNVLLFKNGYIKLTDFGLAKQIKTDEISQTVAGTKIYYAPQLLEKKGYNKAVDFWTLGVFLHQLILCCPPYDGYSIVPGRFTNLCLKAEQNRDWKGIKVSPEAKNLINSFLKVKPEQRLGMSPNGFQDIKNHPFFNKFDWEALNEMKMQSPLLDIVRQFPVKPKLGFSSKNQESKDSGYQIEGLTYNPDTLKERNSNLN